MRSKPKPAGLMRYRGSRSDSGYRVEGDLLKPNGPEVDHWPFEQNRGSPLYIQFAALRTAPDVLEFADKHGLVDRSVSYTLSWAGWFDEVLRWRQGQGGRPTYRSLDPDENDWLFAKINFELSPDGEVMLTIEPNEFLAALVFSMGEGLSGAGQIKTCPECGIRFLTNGVQRRKNARFCCEAHKKKWFNSQGAPAKRLKS